MKSQGIEKNKDEHMKVYKKIMMIAMSQNKKLERDHIYKRSIVHLIVLVNILSTHMHILI
jgi:hypothetical protein